MDIWILSPGSGSVTSNVFITVPERERTNIAQQDLGLIYGKHVSINFIKFHFT